MQRANMFAHTDVSGNSALILGDGVRIQARGCQNRAFYIASMNRIWPWLVSAHLARAQMLRTVILSERMLPKYSHLMWLKSDSASNLGLAAKFDHAIGRDAEEVRRRERVAVHDLENPAAETAEVRMFGRDDLDTADEE
jgi:hypothetical protein